MIQSAPQARQQLTTLCVDQTAAGPMATTLLQTNTRGLKAQVGTLPYMSPEQVAVAMAESSGRPSLYFLWGITNEIQRGASKWQYRPWLEQEFASDHHEREREREHQQRLAQLLRTDRWLDECCRSGGQSRVSVAWRGACRLVVMSDSGL